MIASYGGYTYALLFVIVFLETGLVVTPILPGDSLLFAAGTFAALGSLNVWLVVWLLCVAAILGDTVNYAIGQLPRAEGVPFPKSRFFNPEHLQEDARVLREVRRQDHHHRPLRAHHPHLRALRRGHRGDDLREVPRLQRRRRRRSGCSSACSPATSSATCRS